MNSWSVYRGNPVQVHGIIALIYNRELDIEVLKAEI